LTRRGEDIPTEGVIFRDTRVAGPYPFGGRVGLAVVLCAVVEDDHARDLLGVVESAAGALDFAATVTPYLKVAGVVLDGVDALFGAKKAEPVAGVRSEFDYRDGLRSPHYIAIVASSDLADTTLWVRNGRLEEGPDKENTKAFRRADYVLFSLTGDVTRADVDGLPFAPLRDRALAQANRATTDELWREAKSTLFAASEEALGSPDLIEVHADALIDEWEQRAVTLYGRAKRRADMARTTDGDDGRQRRVARLLDL
jgi:hypothetical protein